MILLCGIPTEAPLAMVRAELDKQGTPYLTFNQRLFDDMAIDFEISPGGVSGRFNCDAEMYRLEEMTGVYTRLMDDRLLPELAEEPRDSARRRRCRALHDALIRWCEITPARVVNRAGPMASNFSKPYQAQLIRAHGFAVPETLSLMIWSWSMSFGDGIRE